MKRDPSGYNREARAQMERLGVNFSTSKELLALARAHAPELRFEADTPRAWKAWHRRFRAKVEQCLGPDLPKVAPRPRVVEKTDAGDHWRYKLVYRTTAHTGAPADLLAPKSFPPNERVPAVLTIHGHGYSGCDLDGKVYIGTTKYGVNAYLVEFDPVLMDTYWRPGEGRCMITAGNGITGDCPIASLEAFLDETFNYGQSVATR